MKTSPRANQLFAQTDGPPSRKPSQAKASEARQPEGPAPEGRPPIPSALIRMVEEYDSEFGISPALRKKLMGILGRNTPERVASGLTVMALKAFPHSRLQQLLQNLREAVLKP